MIVNDIYQDVREILAYGDQTLILSRLSDAVECLNNKGDFDALLGYVLIRPTGNIVTLPPDVRTPIKITLNDNPSFTRDRWYEFTLNGPGTNATLVDWQWLDRGFVPVFAQPPAISALLLTGNVADNGLTVTVTGRTDTLGTLQTVVYTLGEISPSTVQFNFIDKVVKQASSFPMTLSDTHSNVLSVYTATETEPQYRQIKISNTGAAVYIQFRRANFRVTQLTDTIPIHSKMGILFMVKGLEAYRAEDINAATQFAAQALQLANEEQAGHDKFVEIANASQLATIRNIAMGDRDNFVVADIYDEASKILGPMGELHVYDRINDAVRALRNSMLKQGGFDIDIGYLSITASGNLISLPREVESPLKINLNDNPSFARDKLYEFTQNGPGADAPRVGWSWEDKGFSPVTFQPSAPSALSVLGLPADNGVVVTITGQQVDGSSATTELAIGSIGATPLLTRVTRIFKPITSGPVSIATADGTQLASYGPTEQEPTYRQIRISAENAAVYITYRKKNIFVTSLEDVIPIRSRSALIFMIQAMQDYRDGKDGSTLEAKAIALAMEEQESQNAFKDISANTESASVLNLNYNNEDSVIVGDIYDDVCKIMGPIGRAQIFDVITEARSILGRKCQWDSMRGMVDINTDQYRYVTLPRYVHSVLKININGVPTNPRNLWYQFHLNGPGSRDYCLLRWEWQEIGEVVTLRDVPYALSLKAVPDSQTDDGGNIIVHGYFRGRLLQTQDDQGNYINGMLVPLDSAGVKTAPALIDRITRIEKPVTNGFVQLIGVDSTGMNTPFNVGYYEPDETEPLYRRIKLSRNCTQIRLMYRLRTAKIASLTDPLHLRSKSAIVCMVRSMKALDGGDYQNAEIMEVKAQKYIMEEQSINNQANEMTIETPASFAISRNFVRS